MKKFLYASCVSVLLLSACAKKATPDQVLCECMDQETAAYIAEHPKLEAQELSAAREAVGTRCAAKLEQAFGNTSEAEQKEFNQLYTKQQQQVMESTMKRCVDNAVAKLEKSIADNADSALKAEMLNDEDANNSLVDTGPESADANAGNCEDFLAKYESYADSYAAVAAKYARNPADISIVSEYTEMAAKAEEIDQLKPDACEADVAFMKRYSGITAKVTKAAAAQMQGSAKMLEQMAK